MPRKPATKKSASRPQAKEQSQPFAFDAEVFLNPGVGGIQTDAGGRPKTDKGGRPLRKDA